MTSPQFLDFWNISIHICQERLCNALLLHPSVGIICGSSQGPLLENITSLTICVTQEEQDEWGMNRGRGGMEDELRGRGMGYSSMRHIFGGSYDSILPQALSVWKGAVYIVNLHRITILHLYIIQALTLTCGSFFPPHDWTKNFGFVYVFHLKSCIGRKCPQIFQAQMYCYRLGFKNFQFYSNMCPL